MSDLTAEQRTELVAAIHDVLFDTGISDDVVWRDAVMVLDNVAPLIGDLVADARADALNSAADDLEGGLGVEGIPRTLWDFRQWLRWRANREAGAS